MEYNHSPKLVFTPDNDTDDYTQVIAYINEEFARIQEEEVGDAKETTQETITIDDRIVELMKADPAVTRKEIAERLGLKPDNTK